MTAINFGGWSKDLPLMPVDIAAFQKINKKIGLGVIYIPFLVRKQVAAGTNYVFTALAIYPKNTYRVVEIAAYIDLKGNVHNIRITPLLTAPSVSSGFVGGFSKPRVPSEEEKALFAKAIAPIKPLGVNYEPVLVSKQIVNGTNYAFLVRVEVVNPQHTLIGYVPVMIHVAPDGTITTPTLPTSL